MVTMRCTVATLLIMASIIMASKVLSSPTPMDPEEPKIVKVTNPTPSTAVYQIENGPVTIVTQGTQTAGAPAYPANSVQVNEYISFEVVRDSPRCKCAIL
ncbi:hypothetical protein SeMB42_g02222 [Synchytrium endobioticum]|uniref:Uncharacterized protein n=1 Tax=Synchytrium endobioticum TaxID=286115 RepID=A0A507DFT2_9FUNG|nr:hypothetical protein SeMB42_g02222 [Synchytrium endobioticum]